jgi:basic membrane lipoprotein Med (substrate-binding protein (PBP1-ABC) superfamily)
VLDQSRIALEEYFGRDKIITDYVQGFVEGFDTRDGASPACLAVVRDFYEKGYRLIIAPGGYSECLQQSHNNLTDLHILRVGESSGVDLSLNPFANFSRLSTAFVRIWEARFASGIIAGAYTRTGRICFIVGFRNRLSVRDTLALHLGASITRPGVKTYFMTAGGFDNSTLAKIASETLIEKYNCDVLIGVRGFFVLQLIISR